MIFAMSHAVQRHRDLAQKEIIVDARLEQRLLELSETQNGVRPGSDQLKIQERAWTRRFFTGRSAATLPHQVTFYFDFRDRDVRSISERPMTLGLSGGVGSDSPAALI